MYANCPAHHFQRKLKNTGHTKTFSVSHSGIIILKNRTFLRGWEAEAQMDLGHKSGDQVALFDEKKSSKIS
jgi:hypothetical protein